MGNLVELASGQTPYLVEIGLLEEGNAPNEIQMLMDNALTGSIVFLPFAAGTMSRFEKELYADELPADRFQARWWELAGRYQGIEPPGARPDDGCDACTKTHINDDAAEYYDYALAEVLVYQLHDHICRNLLHQDPRACNYYQHREAGEFLSRIMRLGATRDWRTVLREETGSDLSAAPMLEYYRPLMEHLARENEGHDCAFE
jgi:peptidyl-dipeptidase A